MYAKKNSCDLEEYKAFRRIEELKSELEDPWEDDDDDDGDVLVKGENTKQRKLLLYLLGNSDGCYCSQVFTLLYMKLAEILDKPIQVELVTPVKLRL